MVASIAPEIEKYASRRVGPKRPMGHRIGAPKARRLLVRVLYGRLEIEMKMRMGKEKGWFSSDHSLGW